jgi:hypothetical protein
MKIYFMSTPRGKRQSNNNYSAIYNLIKELGHTNVTDFLIDVDVDKFYLSDIHSFYQQTLKDLKSADICVFETSAPSLAVGHLISTAIENEKPVIALYTQGNLPFFLSGTNDDKVQVVEYNLSNLKSILKQAISYAQEAADTRFNFFISPKIGNYLDWVAKEKRIPRAVYLRRLIEEDMKKNQVSVGE